MLKRRYILAMVLGGLLTQSAFAAPGHGDDRERRHEEERHERPRPPGGRMTPGEAAERAQRNHGGGRVLAVDPAGNGYRVKLLQRGDVNIVVVPAE